MFKMNRRQFGRLMALAPPTASLLNAQAPAPPPRFALPRWDINAMQQHLYHPQDPYVMIAAHRGLWRTTPENSETGFRLSFAQWEAVETDLLKPKDWQQQEQLVITHDPEISRTLNGTGWHFDITLAQFSELRLLDRFGNLYNGGNWYPKDSLGDPANDANTGAGRKVLTLEQFLDVHKDFITVTNGKPYGPLIIFDVKAARNQNDPEWNAPGRGIYSTMNLVIKVLKGRVNPSDPRTLAQLNSIIFMFRYNLLPDPAAPSRTALQNFLSNVPAYETYSPIHNPLPRLMPIFNYEDSKLANPSLDSNFMSLVGAPFLSHFEMNQWYLGDGCQSYLQYLTTRPAPNPIGISTYSENAFFRQGVWDIDKFVMRNQDFSQGKVDFRQLPDYTLANAGVGLITTERPEETDGFLRQYNMRNVPKLS